MRARAELAERVAVGDSALALGAECRDRVAQLLDLGEAHIAIADTRDEARNARIIARTLDRIERLDQGQAIGIEQAFDSTIGRLVGQRPRQIEGEDRALADMWTARLSDSEEGYTAGDDEKDNDAEDREEADNDAPERPHRL